MPAMQISEAHAAEAGARIRSPKGRLLALDLGAKRVGVAISDELRITVRALPLIERRSWKVLLDRVRRLVEQHEVEALVIGLPLRLDGREGEASRAAREVSEKFRRSLHLPVYLQNESLTTFEAESHLKSSGSKIKKVAVQIDSEAAAIILRDFIAVHET
jgi:putative holliday junction resolvase